jgi:hypothetical protein
MPDKHLFLEKDDTQAHRDNIQSGHGQVTPSFARGTTCRVREQSDGSVRGFCYLLRRTGEK